MPTTPDVVINFWREAGPSAWFTKSEAFDDCFRDRFLAAHFQAARRELDGWATTPEGGLALLILLDQFPRNAFRGTGHMYATDGLARQYARRLLADRGDLKLAPDLRLFCYLPLSHSEALADQDQAVALNEALDRDAGEHARRHRDIVRRFGRFPHRNPLLGRETTAAEADFLAAGGFAG